MSFLTPFFLWALPLISVPLIIHFLNRRNIKTVDFSTIRFLKKMEHESIRKLKILQILLLIIRTLMILCIVMMLSRPVMRGLFNWIDDPDSTFAAILIDDSFSNFGDSEFISHSDIDRKYFEGILKSIAKDATVSLSTLTRGEVYRGRKGDLQRAGDLMKLSYGAGNFYERFRDVAASLNRDYANKELYILSDGQATNFEYSLEDSLDLEDWDIYFNRLPMVESNLAVADVTLLTEIPITNVPVEIAVEVVNNGLKDVTNALMQMIINGINVGQQVISLEAGQQGSFSFKTAFHENGRIRGEVHLQNDNRNEDNTYYFHVNLPERATVQLFSPSPEDPLFVKNALNAINKDSVLLDIRQSLDSELPSADLRQTDILIFEGIRSVSSGTQEKIRTFVERGGHFILFPGKSQKGLLPLDFLSINSETLGQVSLTDDAFQVIDETSISGNSWLSVLDGEKGSPIKYFRFLGLKDAGHTFVRLKNRQSIWNRQRFGLGLVDLFAFAPDLEWTNFPLKGSFIPFWHLLLYSNKTDGQSNGIASDQRWRRQLAPQDLSGTISMIQPDGTTLILNPDTDLVLTIDSFQQAGFTTIVSGAKVLDELAVNPPGAEISAPLLTGEQIHQKLTERTLIIDDYHNLIAAMENARHGSELWYWFLILLVILTILEMYLSNVYGTRSSRD